LRERWFGATGRRVPELAAEGTLDLDDAQLRATFEACRPIVVRAASAEQIKAALARPEVACALVPADRDDLLSLDLTELTYG